MTAATLRFAVNNLESYLTDYQKALAGLRPPDPRILPEVAAQDTRLMRQRLHERTQERAVDTGRRIFGDEQNPSLPLQGGMFWTSHEEATESLRAAKNDAGKDINWTRVQVEALRLPAVLAGHRTTRELNDWFTTASDTERLALSYAPGLVEGRFPGDPSIGAILARIERNRAGMELSPKVVAAEAELSAVNAQRLRGWKVGRALAGALGDTGLLARGFGRILARINADISVDPVTLVETGVFSKKSPSVVSPGLREEGGDD